MMDMAQVLQRILFLMQPGFEPGFPAWWTISTATDQGVKVDHHIPSQGSPGVYPSCL